MDNNKFGGYIIIENGRTLYYYYYYHLNNVTKSKNVTLQLTKYQSISPVFNDLWLACSIVALVISCNHDCSRRDGHSFTHCDPLRFVLRKLKLIVYSWFCLRGSTF